MYQILSVKEPGALFLETILFSQNYEFEIL